MKKKIIGLGVVILIVSLLIIPVTALTDRHNIRVSSYNVDVPTWEKGDEWTYQFIQSRTAVYNYNFLGDLTLKVIDDSGDSYVLEAETKPKGTFDLGGIGLKTTRFSSISMRLQVRKNDLGLESFTEEIKGIFLIRIGTVTLPIPIHFTACFIVEFDPTWIILPFPLSDGKHGNLSGTELLHIFYANLFWGQIPLFDPQNISLPLTDLPYTCSEEQITVQGNTFDVYNVSAEWFEEYKFISYFAKEVGNIVKEVIYIPWGGGTVWCSLVLELKDWSYTP